MSNVKFTGVIPAMVTPLCEDNRTVNTASVKSIVERQISEGANGFYILGGTGEGFVMPREQREIMCESMVRAVGGRVPIINHVAAANLSDAIELARHAERAGVDAIAAIPPTLFHYGDGEIYNYYKKLAESVHIPVIIYYYPGAQAVMSASLISHIFEIDNVTGVKWSSINFIEMIKLKDMTNGDMNILNGEDFILLPSLAAGADAGVGATYNVMLPEFVSIYKDFKAGRLDAALETQRKVNRVAEFFCNNEVIPSVKLAMKLLGNDVGAATLPLRQFTSEEEATFEREIRALGWPFK